MVPIGVICAILCLVGLIAEYKLFLVGLVLFFVNVWISIILNKTIDKPDFKTEYKLELINQDSVKIKSNRTNKIYYEKPEYIHKVLDKDNL